MGLASGFKQYLSEVLPEAVNSTNVVGDLCILDVLCIIHAFRPSTDGDCPVFEQLVRRIADAAAPACAPNGTLLVCFDRQDATPAQKMGTQAKRHKPSKVWTAEEAAALMVMRDLPVGAAWDDLLATRDVRGRMFEELCVALFERFADGGFRNVTQLIVHNGRPGGGAQVATVGAPAAEAPAGAPTAGEADVAMAQWARFWRGDHPEGRVVVISVDTDIIPLIMLHGGSRSSVCLTHSEQRHRLAVDTAELARLVAAKYRLTPQEFVVLAISKKTDFAPACLRGLPDWHTTMLWGGAFLRGTKDCLVRDGILDYTIFARMLADVALRKPRVSVAKLTPEQREAVRWNTAYWCRLEA